MTAELTSRLVVLEAAATPGPWTVGKTFRRIDRTTCAELLIPGHPRGNPFIAENNAALIAEVRNALPALLNLVEAARAFFNVEWGETRSDSAVPFMEAERKLRDALEALGGER